MKEKKLKAGYDKCNGHIQSPTEMENVTASQWDGCF